MDNQKEFNSSDVIAVEAVKKNDIQNSAKLYEGRPGNLNNENDVGNNRLFSIFSKFKKSLSSAEETGRKNIAGNPNDGATMQSVKTSEKTIGLESYANTQTAENAPEYIGRDSILANAATEDKSVGNGNVSASKSLLDKVNTALKDTSISKVFSNKNNKIAVGVIILAIVLVMFLNMSNGLKSASDKTSGNFNNVEYVSSKAFIENLENNLTATLSKIKGAGVVNVMVTLESGPELKIANSVDERTTTTTAAGSTTTTNINVIKNPILITQNGKTSPLILMEIMPVIKGVIVVAQGANNTKVKLELLEAVQALLDVPNDNVQIYAGI